MVLATEETTVTQALWFLKSNTYEEQLCAVTLLSSERGTQFHPLVSYFLVQILLFIYFQVSTGVAYLLDYVEDIYDASWWSSLPQFQSLNQTLCIYH